MIDFKEIPASCNHVFVFRGLENKGIMVLDCYSMISAGALSGLEGALSGMGPFWGGPFRDTFFSVYSRKGYNPQFTESELKFSFKMSILISNQGPDNTKGWFSPLVWEGLMDCAAFWLNHSMQGAKADVVKLDAHGHGCASACRLFCLLWAHRASGP